MEEPEGQLQLLGPQLLDHGVVERGQKGLAQAHVRLLENAAVDVHHVQGLLVVQRIGVHHELVAGRSESAHEDLVFLLGLGLLVHEHYFRLT